MNSVTSVRLPYGPSDGNVQTVQVTLYEEIDRKATLAAVDTFAERTHAELDRAGINLQGEPEVTALRGRTLVELGVYAHKADITVLLGALEAIFQTSVYDRLKEIDSALV